jgi:hypothetical protein
MTTIVPIHEQVEPTSIVKGAVQANNKGVLDLLEHRSLGVGALHVELLDDQVLAHGLERHDSPRRFLAHLYVLWRYCSVRMPAGSCSSMLAGSCSHMLAGSCSRSSRRKCVQSDVYSNGMDQSSHESSEPRLINTVASRAQRGKGGAPDRPKP